MGKVVDLKLNLQAEHSYHVTLSIYQEGQSTQRQVSAQLPPAIDLLKQYQKWQDSYRRLSQFGSRAIRPKQITINGDIQQRRDECRQRGKQLNHALNQWLQSPGFRTIRETWLDEISQSESVRVIIQTDQVETRHLPWHCWDLVETRSPQSEIAFGASNFRAPKPKAIPQTDAVKILAILGNSDGIDIDHDRQTLQQLSNADVTFLVQPDRRDVSGQLWQQHWDIIFFAGHSCTEGETGRIYLNAEDSLTLDELRAGLTYAVNNGLQLAIFNSCDGLGLASELEKLHIPQLIVMREPVPDQVAQLFLTYFLQAFAEDLSLYLAVREARQRLEAIEDEFPNASWLPVIFQNPAVRPPTWSSLCGDAQMPSETTKISWGQPLTTSKVVVVPPVPYKRRWLSKRQAAVLTCGVTALGLGLRHLGLFEQGELWVYDRFAQIQAASPVSAGKQKILLVTINDQDVQKYDNPISDRVLLDGLRRIQQQQPRAVGIDIYRDSPVAKQADWVALTKYLKQTPQVVGLCQVGEVNGVIRPEMAVKPPQAMPMERVGYADGLIPDPDQRVRRYSFAMDEREGAVCQTPFSFAFQVLNTYYQGNLQYEYDDVKGLKLWPENQANQAIWLPPLSPRLGGYHRSTGDMAGVQLVIDYTGLKQAQLINFETLLTSPENDLRSLVRDRIVLIGYASGQDPQKSDLHLTPVEQTYGVRIHAQVIQQILKMFSGIGKITRSLSEWSETGLLAILGLVSGAFTWRWGRWRYGFLVGMGLAAALVMLQHSLAGVLWLPIFSGLLIFGMNSLVVFIVGNWKGRSRSSYR
ncbi:CHASE2 domain-containing protein [filamentous cyanobacterium LEGE 11480]|uniref:CHASE2 domain-containing protein n=1 Tax=Romeriopsis navalis LEGE 11480 TaxID=2777977 RepID=A0A928VV05_9CYAN|nr:CHASE2 domain-containing protein [Romeriopsis navalis]MBE9032559.1 CHASE2 domain-containing protein [Romeriopsis navalis LEGE 11480]